MAAGTDTIRPDTVQPGTVQPGTVQPGTIQPGTIRSDTIWDTIERTLAGLLGAIAMAVGLVQVLGRYFFPALAISWAEEVIVYLVVWAVMIISSQLVRTDGHVRPDLVLRLVPPGGQRWLEAFNCVVALVFCGGMIWYGWQIVDTSLLLDERSSSGLQFPMWIYYASLPAGGVLMCMRYLIRLYRYVFRFDPATMTAGHHIPDHERAGVATLGDPTLGDPTLGHH